MLGQTYVHGVRQFLAVFLGGLLLHSRELSLVAMSRIEGIGGILDGIGSEAPKGGRDGHGGRCRRDEAKRERGYRVWSGRAAQLMNTTGEGN